MNTQFNLSELLIVIFILIILLVVFVGLAVINFRKTKSGLENLNKGHGKFNSFHTLLSLDVPTIAVIPSVILLVIIALIVLASFL